MGRNKTGGLVSIVSLALVLQFTTFCSAFAENWTNGISTIGELKYGPDFAHFDYVNPDAPKRGSATIGTLGTFDTFNPVVSKGNLADGMGLVFETLMKPSLDEPFSAYGLIAETISYPPDFSSASFKLRAEAKWADGTPITVEDVIYSLEKSKQLDPEKESYYQNVVKVEKIGDREVKFVFKLKNNRELPNIVGQMQIVPKHWWEAANAAGKKRNLGGTTLEPVMGSGPYKIGRMSPGSSITFELRDDYWGKNLPVNIGYNNFKSLKYLYFGDINVEFEAFKGGVLDFWNENEAKRWATAYEFPAVKDGRIRKETHDNDSRDQGVMVGFIMNMRKDKFKDIRVRKALNYALDFETLNRMVFNMQYKRLNSFFFGTELASSGLPTGRELEILNEFKGKIPDEIFTTVYQNPVGGNEKKLRANLRQALDLFKQAGYELRGKRLVNIKTGEPFTFEIMLNMPIITRVALPYAANLSRIGIVASVRSVDDSQFTERWRKRNFEVIYTGWRESLNPGNEQATYWGSKWAAKEGTQNYSGIADPVIDELINKIIFAPDRDSQVAAVKALDRVLLNTHIIVPSYTIRTSRIAFWNKFDRPRELPKYSTAFPAIWWAK